MDINHKDGYGTKQPKGSATTLLDLVSRDIQDNTLFPLNANITRFTRDEGLRTIPLSTVMREFTFKGPATFGQTFTFELGDMNCGDLISGLFIQLQLGDWLTGITRNKLINGVLVPYTPLELWTYCNSVGSSILEEATLEVDDQVLERITGDSVHVSSLLFPDLNCQFGLADTLGFKSLDDIKNANGLNPFFTEEGWVTVPLMFSMLREKLTATFPLISCRAGTIRIRVTLKKFSQIVRVLSGSRMTCDDTPTGKTFQVINNTLSFNKLTQVSAYADEPQLKNIQLLTQGIFVDGPYREMLLRDPFERPFREIQQFDFTEPLKYLVNKSGNDMITVQLPLEANGPVEEIVWFLRRKAAVTLNNDWTNYSATLEKDYHPTFAPLEPLLLSAKIQANGQDIIQQDESWFRSQIARAHKSGKTSYDAFLYGYSFAKNPGEHDPTGTINASRLNSLRLTLNVKPPAGSSDTEWEVHVFVYAFQWVRFGNGICNKVFID
uniref:Major capsid protein C-terminal domain-containing protein n=1 Tax=viral metagenome TaxID=1070528 RepID=A0A6C0ANP6_9ZZZZ